MVKNISAKSADFPGIMDLSFSLPGWVKAIKVIEACQEVFKGKVPQEALGIRGLGL